MLLRHLISVAISLCFATNLLNAQSPALDLKPGDHIVWIGNTFAERMQYFGEVESRLHARYPNHRLVVRNIAWPADTVSMRPRPAEFGDVHHYLGQMKADVIFACFGFNETWDYGGELGVGRFKADLTKFVRSLKAKKYNGESPPEIVLYSPIACEGDQVPDKAERNSLLGLYAESMAEVAAELDVFYVDLFGPSSALFVSASKTPLTINGMHLTAGGYAELAPEILDAKLFGPIDKAGASRLDSIRREVMNKNDTFFEWYRTVNSLYIHGERKGLHKFFKSERKKLLQMTAIRDQRIWDASMGKELAATIDDSSTEEIRPKVSGRLSGVSKALSPEEEYKKFEIGDEFKVELFASEREFPELRNPVSINFDAEGRLWIATLPSYPHAFPGVEPNDQLIILEDTDGDGKADKRSVWADGLYLPLGFEFGNGGVYVSQEPNLVFLEDGDGDGAADKETILFHGFGSEDSHHAIHDFVWGPGGGLYMSESTFHNSQVETNRGPRRTKNNAVFRLDPRTNYLDVVSRIPSGGNPWGHVIDAWGEHLFIGRPLNVGLINQPKLANFFATNAPNDITDDTRFCGQEFITSHHWPEEFQGKVFSNRYKDLQGVLLHDWTENGSSFNHNRIKKVLEARNKACIPVDVQLGPDGALYVVDWYNPILGHMQYSLRHELRDSRMGRIWRITYKDRPLDTPPRIAGASVEELLENLKAYEDRTRYRTRRELWELPSSTLRPALEKWVTNLDESRPGFAHHLTEALWLHQQRGWVNEELFVQVSTHPDHHARAAAAHLLRFWAENLPDAREHFLRLAADKHVKVRLETVVSCTWVDPSIAVEVIEIIGDLEQDKNLKLGYDYARRALKPTLENHPMMMPADRLASLPLSDQVVKALVRRPSLDQDLRKKALAHLTEKSGNSSTSTLVALISDLDQRREPSLPDWLAILDGVATSEITGSADAVRELVARKTPEVRQAAYAALVRSGVRTDATTDPDYYRSITRLEAASQRQLFFAQAHAVFTMSDARVDLQRAALFALGRVPEKHDAVFEKLAPSLQNEDLRGAAAEALLAQGAAAWPARRAGELLADYLPILEKTSVERRGGDGFLRLSELLDTIAAKGEQSEVQKRIASLQLRPVKITTVPDQLRFDLKTFEVQSGSPVELRFDNPDPIQHNIVICSPGSMEKVGLGVDALLTDPKGMGRDWIPDLPEVLHHTPMANAEESVFVRFMAPKKPGRYPFLCTVPGHWRVMQGHMIVTDSPSVSSSASKTEKPRVLILTGETEYRTSETLGALGKQLREEYGMEATHLDVEKKGEQHQFAALGDSLDKADLLILSVRFLNLVKADYEALEAYLSGPKSFIAVRTSTHPFAFPGASGLAKENRAFPERHFGTPYRGHHGHKTSQVNYVMAARHPVMRGISPRFWTPDFVYGSNPLAVHCTPLMVGQGLEGTRPTQFKKENPGNHVYVLSDKEQGRVIGSPHPVVWTVGSPDGEERSLVSTIGARKSFDDPNVQRLYLNAVLWCLGKEDKIPESKQAGK